VYRLLNTLEARGLAARDARGRYTIGLRVIDLARTAFGSLQSIAAPVLTGLAEITGATATITVADGNEAVLLSSVEPPNSALYLSYRPGFRHALDRSAFGMAILSGRPPQPGERPEIAHARARGYAVSFGEVMPGGIGIAAPIVVRDASPTACIGVAIVNGELNEPVVAPQVIAAGKQLAAMLIRPT
jgi:DNA-binding IclR family transcriptional regulator